MEDLEIGDFVTTQGNDISYGKMVHEIVAIEEDKIGFLIGLDKKLEFIYGRFFKRVKLFKTIVVVDNKEIVTTLPFFWHNPTDVQKVDTTLLERILRFRDNVEKVLMPNGRFYCLTKKRFDAYVFYFNDLVNHNKKTIEGCIGLGIYSDQSIEYIYFYFEWDNKDFLYNFQKKAREIRKRKGLILEKVILERLDGHDEIFQLN